MQVEITGKYVSISTAACMVHAQQPASQKLRASALALGRGYVRTTFGTSTSSDGGKES